LERGSIVPTLTFQIGTAFVRLLTVLLLVLSGASAMADGVARLTLSIPPAASSAGVTMLEVGLSVTRADPAGHLGAVVRLRRPDGAPAEVGRLSIVGSGGQYQFNVAPALKRLGLIGGSAEVEVALIERGGGAVPAGAQLAISHARIVTR
jgi:hypothetical protein